METARFDSRVVRDLRVTGTLENNGKQKRVTRCYATFRAQDNPGISTGATLANGHRYSLTPMRVYDYQTSKPFKPPPNATIRAVTVVGKTATDHASLVSLATKVSTAVPTGHNGFAIGVMRSPIPSAGADTPDTVAPVVNVAAGTTTFLVTGGTPGAARVANSSDTYTTGAEEANPYKYFYSFLSPLSNPMLAFANAHVGVCYEYADKVLSANTGGIRLEWGSPKATTGLELNSAANDVATKNPGLSLFITPFGRTATGAPVNANAINPPAAPVDIALDVIVELEYDANVTTYSSFASSNDDLASTVD